MSRSLSSKGKSCSLSLEIYLMKLKYFLLKRYVVKSELSKDYNQINFSNK